MAAIFHLDLSGSSPAQAVLKTGAALESEALETLTVGLGSEAAAREVADFLRSWGLKTESYRHSGQWLVLGRPADSPEILVWHGPEGWQAAMDERPRPPEPVVDLVRPLRPPLHGDRAPAEEPGVEGETVVLVGSRFMGTGDEALGARLAAHFFESLADLAQPLSLIALYNSGVFLSTRASEAVPALKDLAGQGAEIISCGISLDHYGLKDSLQVGRVGRMREIIAAQRRATHVIRL